MKTFKKISAFLVAAIMLVCMTACGNKLESFKITNGESISLEVGYTVRLKTDAPADVVSEVEWSANNDCVTVDATGYVIAKKAGDAEVTAKYGKQTATIKITVTASSQGTGNGTADTPTQTPSTNNGTSSTPSTGNNNNNNTNTNTNKPSGSTGNGNTNTNTGTVTGTTDIKTGVAYKLFLNNGTIYYAKNATQNDEGKFILTDTLAANGADYYAESASGGFKFYTTVSGSKQYLTASTQPNGEKVSKFIGFSTNGSIWKYNTSVKAWYTTIDGANYYMGTYGTFTTVSISTENYFTDAEKRATQFEANFIEKTKAPAGSSSSNNNNNTNNGGGSGVDTSTANKIVLTVDSLAIPSQQYTDTTATVGGTAFEWKQIGNYGNGLQMRDRTDEEGKTTFLWNTAAFSKGIKEIQITLNSGKKVYDNPNAQIYSFGDAAGNYTYTTKLSTQADKTTYTITPDKATYKFFKLEHDLGYTFYIDSITIVLNA